MKKNYFKQNIAFYKKYINSDAFGEYIKNENEESSRNHKDYIEKEHPKWADRTDFCEDAHMSNMYFYDTLTNGGIIRLLQKLYNLSKKDYKVKCHYKKPTLVRKYDYVQLQYSYSSQGSFATINFLKDNFINKIEINWTQINNYFAFLEYRINFKVPIIDDKDIKFILDHIDLVSNKDYKIWYYQLDENNLKESFFTLKQMHNDYFLLICQHFITSLLYTEQGKYHKLISIAFYMRSQKIDINKIYLGDVTTTYYNKEQNFIMSSDVSEYDYSLISGDNFLPNFSFLGYASKFGNEFYYRFFGYRELKIFEAEFSKYATGRKPIRVSKRLISLFNKLQSLSDVNIRRGKKDFLKEFKTDWEFYYANEKEEMNESNTFNVSEFEKIYEKNFTYFKTLIELLYTKSNKTIAWIAIALSIISIIISFLH